MVGSKLRQRKSQARFFVATYALLALFGGALAAVQVRAGESASGVAGFMIVFGVGMTVSALLKSRKAQVVVLEEQLEVHQGKAPRVLPYRRMTGLSRPDRNRLVVTLRDDGGVRNEVVWLKELDPEEVGRLYEFLTKRKGKGALGPPADGLRGAARRASVPGTPVRAGGSDG
jgi:hypothetical protein